MTWGRVKISRTLTNPFANSTSQDYSQAAEEKDEHQEQQGRQYTFSQAITTNPNYNFVIESSGSKVQRISAADPETHSASIDIEDLIEEFDEPSSRRSFHDSNPHLIAQKQKRLQQLNNSQTTIPNRDQNDNEPKSSLTQSYFSIGNLVASQSYKTVKDNDETISFYSALQDGFSLDEFEWRDKFSRDFFSNYNSQNSSSRNGERDSMLQVSNFQVFWSDLTYTINKPNAKFSNALDDLRRLINESWFLFNSSTRFASCLSSDNNNNNNIRSNLDQKQSECDDYNDEQLATDNNNNDFKATILQHLNGSFRSSQLTAVMGPSGAGKTSLLNILSRRREDGFTGHLNVESDDLNDQHKIQINSIPQHDHLPEYLTVRESLLFASRLKNSSANHEKNVCRVSNLLGLETCLNTRTRNISGGEHKRLAIAQELLSRPDILILDEPTTGLDSATCLKTLLVLKDLVRASARKIIDPIAIVLTIHQPQQEAFNLFDKVYVIANGGLTIYDGPPNKCLDFVYEHTGMVMPSPDYNPASFMIDIASGEYGNEPIFKLGKQVRLEHEKERSQKSVQKNSIIEERNINNCVGQEQQQQQQGEDSIQAEAISIDNCNSSTAFKQPQQQSLYLDSRLVKGSAMNNGEFFYKTRVLTERCWLSMTRDRKNTLVRIAFHLLLPFGLAMMLGQGQPGQSNACPKFRQDYPLVGLMKSDEYISPEVQNEFLVALENTGIIFITIHSCISANIAAMTLMFAIDMGSSLKEYYNGWYSMNSYIFARILSNLPMNLILPTSTVALLYIVTEQNTGYGDLLDVLRILITALAVVLGSLVGELMGMMFGAIYMGQITTALFASQGATLPFVLLSGFVARTKNMSAFVRGLSMTSLYKHCLEIAFIARYGWNVCGCDKNETHDKEPRITGVPDKLRKFVDYWQSSQADYGQEDQQQINDGNSTNKDLFQMMAKQISLYNTYGIDIKSCEQVVPYELNDFGLSERDLPYSFANLFGLLLFMLILVILVLEFVITRRTSL